MKGESVVERPCPCFLCNGNADVYCESDSAYLCFSCDSSVHSANFLVARHLRRLLCLSCRHLSSKSFSGPRSPPLLRFSCRSCSPNTDTDHEDEAVDVEDSISCVSTTETTPSRAARSGGHVPGKRGSEDSTRSLRTAKAEGIFVNWCRKLGLHRDSILPVATQAIGLPSLPFRVGLAVSFWYGVRSCGVATWRNLRRLEEVSGVPGKLIVAVEMKLERALRLLSRRRRRFVAAAEGRKDLEEGWAEC